MTIGMQNYYFSGSQAEVWVEGVKLTEAVDISGVCSIQQIPIYGYASQLWDAIAPGRSITQGSFSINYVFNGYLLALLQKAYKQKNLSLSGAESDKSSNIVANNMQSQTVLNTDTTANSQFYQQLRTEQRELETQYNELINMLDTDHINELKKMYWPSRERQNGMHSIRPEFKYVFNLFIKDYRINFLTSSNEPEEKMIVNAVINEVQTVRNSDGTPVIERYSFIAKNLI